MEELSLSEFLGCCSDFDNILTSFSRRNNYSCIYRLNSLTFSPKTEQAKMLVNLLADIKSPFTYVK